MNIKILCIGDIVGAPGIEMVQKHVPRLKREMNLDLVVANGENCADGRGITPKLMHTLRHNGIDLVTSGNHIWQKKEIYGYWQDRKDLLRPLNFPSVCPGIGSTLIPVNDQFIGVVNVQGRVFMKELVSCPFRALESTLTFLTTKTKNIIVDFHAETTSEKVCLAHYFDGKVSAVVGTHTHVQTADARILAGGTAFITDLGMTGSLDSSLGMKKEIIIQAMLTQMPVKFAVQTQGPRILCGAVITVNAESGKAVAIEAVWIQD